MTLHTFKGFVDGARDAYLKAVEKHPQFTDRVTDTPLTDISIIVDAAKQENDNIVEDGYVPSFHHIIAEELAEYAEASLLGDTDAAKRELLDCAAVIMREKERISQ